MTHFATTLLQLILKFIITEKQDTKKQTKTIFYNNGSVLLSVHPNGVGGPNEKGDPYVKYLLLWASWIPGV